VRTRRHVVLEKVLIVVLRKPRLGDRMIFITLSRFKGKPTKEMLAQSKKLFERMVQEGGKVLGAYWTLGRYDSVVITEGPDEKAAIQELIRWSDIVSTETLVAVPSEEAVKLVE